jgi:AcrR family transcriptional regulator
MKRRSLSPCARLGRRGFRGTTLEAVADSAKVSVATLYRRYGDRDGLLRAFLAQVPVRKRAFRLRAANEGELRGTLERFAAEMLEEIAASFEVMRAGLGDPESAAVVGRLRDPRRGISAGLGRFFRACLRRGLLAQAPPEELISAFSSLVMGAGFLELASSWSGTRLSLNASCRTRPPGFRRRPLG